MTSQSPPPRGYLTLEIGNHSSERVLIEAGSPIAQIIFQRLDVPTEIPYDGKYQDQPAQAAPAIIGEVRKP